MFVVRLFGKESALEKTQTESFMISRKTRLAVNVAGMGEYRNT
jgi:hypothetical protein